MNNARPRDRFHVSRALVGAVLAGYAGLGRLPDGLDGLFVIEIRPRDLPRAVRAAGGR